MASHVSRAALACLLCTLAAACRNSDKAAKASARQTGRFERAAAPSGKAWNETQIDWRSYDDALVAAAREHKPICLVFFTTWCGHCKNYSMVFNDGRVVQAAKDFVMVRLDRDQHQDLSQKYAPDGDYIPRTYFLASDGSLDADIHAPRPNYKYFYDEANPASLLAGMAEARGKLN
jgi:protein-disulfide reductase (glutathione)